MLESKFYQVYKDQGDGFVVLQLIGENLNSQPPTVAELAGWVDHFQVTFPVLADPQFQIGGAMGGDFVPYYWVIDQQGVIRKKSTYFSTLASFHKIIKKLLGIG